MTGEREQQGNKANGSAFRDAMLRNAKASFDPSKPIAVKVPEWADDIEADRAEGDPPPFDGVLYVTPMTIADERKFAAQAEADPTGTELTIRALIENTRDKDGNRVFTLEDRLFLMKQASPIVVARLSLALKGGDAEKNSIADPS